MAAFAEYSTTQVAHDEAEPNLHGDTGGFGGGIIATQLLHHFAATLSLGATFPRNYNEERPLQDTNAVVVTEITYGNSFNYNLSLGYLVYPKKYRDYQQTNYNVYLELMGKSYGEAAVIQNQIPATIENITLASGNYVEAHLGVQAIINSNTRIDITIGFPLIQRSWDHFYPIYNIGVQHNFYFLKRKSTEK
jgi:hypothetical protein